jgi:adenosylmethionine-8-amino-7-oxononanoate aminotransferase
MGGVYATEEVVAPMAERGDRLMFFTYAAHPASCAAADAVLDIMERENLVARAAETGKRLRAALDDALGDHPHVAEVRGLGLMLGIEIVRDRDTLEPFGMPVVPRIVAEGLARGVWFYPAGSGRAQDVIMLGPPFTITDEDIATICSVLVDAIDAAARRAE